MTSVATRPITIDEFLARPEAESPSLEYLRGEVTEKPMAAEIHGAAVIELGGPVAQSRSRHAYRPRRH